MEEISPNLVTANLDPLFLTIFFTVEPIMNPAEELQAIGRVHRIGQKKATVVHR